MEENPFFIAGNIIGIHGVRGRLKVYPPSETLKSLLPGEIIFLGKNKEKRREFSLNFIKPHKGYLLIGLEGVTTTEKAKELIGYTVLVEKKRLPPLPEGEYYWFQLMGIHVYSENGDYIGKVKEILPMPSNDVYVIEDSNKEYLIPAITSVIQEINLKEKKMVICLLDGLIER